MTPTCKWWSSFSLRCNFFLLLEPVLSVVFKTEQIPTFMQPEGNMGLGNLSVSEHVELALLEGLAGVYACYGKK